MQIEFDSVERNVANALAEDIGSGDINVQLIPEDLHAIATLNTRSTGVLCGIPWVIETCRQVDPNISIVWLFRDGEQLTPNDCIAQFNGSARSLLSAERTIMNFLQLLSATATVTRQCCEIVKHTNVKLLDTRKTVPGLRHAQKYAVAIGGAMNHRQGLFDAYLLKENHIAVAGSITAAAKRARQLRKDVLLEIEVENLDQLEEAYRCNADRVLLDNFNIEQLRNAVRAYGGKIDLEASGGITKNNLVEVAETGVNYISLGMLTKNVQAIDLSMSIEPTPHKE